MLWVRRALLVLAISTSALSSVAADVAMWSQPPVVMGQQNGFPVYDGHESTSCDNQSRAPIVAAMWQSTGAQSITGFRFWGTFCGYENSQIASWLWPNAFHFRLYSTKCATWGFYPDSTPIWDYTASDYALTFTGYERDKHYDGYADAVFLGSVSIADPTMRFETSPGTYYWLSVSMVDEPAVNYPWGWLTQPYTGASCAFSSASHNGTDWQQLSYMNNDWTTSFEIVGTPEPASIVTMLSGFAGLAGLALRRLRKGRN